MNDYILDKLRADSAHLINLSTNEEKLQHNGLRGRFREILINNILEPWLPPYVDCGTGMIIAEENVTRQSTQDDVILYDKSLTPPVMASAKSSEGVFLYNSVLARIEVKSTNTRAALKDFCIASIEISKLKFSVQPGFKGGLYGAFNMFFAYKTDLNNDDPDSEVRRLASVMGELGLDPLSGLVSNLCVVGKGFWKLGYNAEKVLCWQRLNSTNAQDHVTWFIGTTSNSCFQQHAIRQGRDPALGLEGGVGTYLPHPFVDVVL
ncbi:MAG: DUF6602 domain-containing protein [Flavipsychrobacter sp.]